jgi:hypothetical protein
MWKLNMESPSARFDRAAWQRDWRLKNPERAREIGRSHRERHRVAINAGHRARYAARREEYLQKRKAHHQKQKDIAYNAYGGYVCVCCGETRWQFLCIDHVNNDGHEHRKTVGRGGNIYRWLIVNGFPAGFQVLCFNCNQGRRLNHGVCPHVEAQYGIVIREI